MSAFFKVFLLFMALKQMDCHLDTKYLRTRRRLLDDPTPEPTPNPTPKSPPSKNPTPEPTHKPTKNPTPEPTTKPFEISTDRPEPLIIVNRGSTSDPTAEPTVRPTGFPTDLPTENPKDALVKCVEIGSKCIDHDDCCLGALCNGITRICDELRVALEPTSHSSTIEPSSTTQISQIPTKQPSLKDRQTPVSKDFKWIFWNHPGWIGRPNIAKMSESVSSSSQSSSSSSSSDASADRNKYAF